MEPTLYRVACQGCTNCQILPADVRGAITSQMKTSVLHISARFGDKELGLTLDGVNIADNTHEAYVGPTGWAVRYHIHPEATTKYTPHRCPFCSKEPCIYIARGRVEVPQKTKVAASILDELETMGINFG